MDDVSESLLRFKMDRMEERMKSGLAAALYGGGKPQELSEAQKARSPGHYWTRYPGQPWSLDHWERNAWSTIGCDEIWAEDPPEIVGPIEPPATR